MAAPAAEETGVSFPSHCGRFTLRGTLTRGGISRGGATDGAARGVLLLHGGMAHRDSAYQKKLAALLATRLGRTSFRFDHVGCGESVPLFADGDDGGRPEPDEPREQFRNMMGGFWEDLDDTRAAIAHLRNAHGLAVDCVCGHSRGGQLALMLAVRHAAEHGIRGVITVNMRWDLEHWRRQRAKHMATHGRPWVLRWRSRGKALKHTVSARDVDVYASVPMSSASGLCDAGVRVLAVYGRSPGGTGDTIDGVVPLACVSSAVNTLGGACELGFVARAGHNVREEGAAERLFDAVQGWLARTLDSAGAGGRQRASML